MKNEYTAVDGPPLTFTPPRYRCPKHGVVISGTVQLWGADGKLKSEHCMECYQEWVRANIPQVEKL